MPSTPAAVARPVSPTHIFSGSEGDQRSGSHDRAGLDDGRREGDLGEIALERDAIQGDQHRDIGQLRRRDQPLDESDARDDREAQARVAPQQEQRSAERHAEDDRRRVEAMLRGQAGHAERRGAQRDGELHGEAMAGDSARVTLDAVQPARCERISPVLHLPILTPRGTDARHSRRQSSFWRELRTRLEAGIRLEAGLRLEVQVRVLGVTCVLDVELCYGHISNEPDEGEQRDRADRCRRRRRARRCSAC